MCHMVKEQATYGLQFDGVHNDIGNNLGFIKTNPIYGLEHEESGAHLREWQKEYVG